MTDTIRLYGLVTDSIVDGPGFRTSVFTQGCPHHCPGCHNPGSHDFDAGTVYALDDVEAKFSKNPLLDGVTLTGGEPFCQAAACAELARRAHARGLNVWTYTGYTYEKLRDMAASDPDVAALLDATDVLVDGPFLLSERSLELDFRGSRNQRLIDLGKPAPRAKSCSTPRRSGRGRARLPRCFPRPGRSAGLGAALCARLARINPIHPAPRVLRAAFWRNASC